MYGTILSVDGAGACLVAQKCAALSIMKVSTSGASRATATGRETLDIGLCDPSAPSASDDHNGSLQQPRQQSSKEIPSRVAAAASGTIGGRRRSRPSAEGLRRGGIAKCRRGGRPRAIASTAIDQAPGISSDRPAPVWQSRGPGINP